MSIAAAISWFLDTVPFARGLWRWLWERQMEISVKGPTWRDGTEEEFKITVAVEETPGIGDDFDPSIFTHFTLRLLNHRTDRRERITAIRLEVKKPRLFFWRETLARAPVHQRGTSRLVGPVITDIPLEPMSAPVQIQCVVQETFDRSFREKLPVKSEVWLVLDMVGRCGNWNRRSVICGGMWHDGKSR